MPLLFWMPFVIFTTMIEVIADETCRMTAMSASPVKATAVHLPIEL
jgi:hypothetical protein